MLQVFVLDVTSEDGFFCLTPRTEDKRDTEDWVEQGNYDCQGWTNKMMNELRTLVLIAVSLVCQKMFRVHLS